MANSERAFETYNALLTGLDDRTIEGMRSANDRTTRLRRLAQFAHDAVDAFGDVTRELQGGSEDTEADDGSGLLE